MEEKEKERETYQLVDAAGLVESCHIVQLVLFFYRRASIRYDYVFGLNCQALYPIVKM